MSFWLEDDDDEPLQQLTQNSVYSSQASQFVCSNCGGTDSYLDDATGLEVCHICFTSQKSSSQQEYDFEDVAILGARNRAGQIQQQRVKTGRRARQPLIELDQSMPLPDTKLCLRAFQVILQRMVEIVVTDILPTELEVVPSEPPASSKSQDNNESPEDKTLEETVLETVKELWLSYLQSWTDGAEYYGERFPHIRFSFRDLFLSNVHTGQLLRYHLVHQAGLGLDEQQDDDCELNVADTEEEMVVDSSRTEKSRKHQRPDASASIDAPNNPVRKRHATPVRMVAMQRVISSHTANRHKGHLEAALWIRPSMTMAAALVWLGLTKGSTTATTTSATSRDVCRWVNTGRIPLLAAFDKLLDEKLQQKLLAVSQFFRLGRPLRPTELESVATNLCVACRLKIQPRYVGAIVDGKQPAVAVVSKRQGGRHVRFWTLENLPRIIARFVADAGLGQYVLDRTLALLGLAETFETPVLTDTLQLSTMEEVLAVIAIACQMDPAWRTWKYELSLHDAQAVPWNETQFRLLPCGPSLKGYLTFVEQHVFPKSDAVDGRARSTLLPDEYFDVGDASTTKQDPVEEAAEQRKAESSAGLPSTLVSGATAPLKPDVTNLKYRRNAQERENKVKAKKYPTRSLFLVPKYDFYQADRAASDWSPCRDVDQDRLLQFLSVAADSDPDQVRLAMNRLLAQKKL